MTDLRIGVIAASAFDRVSNVDYVYIRRSRVEHVERGAFGGMHNVSHLFLRDNVTIGKMDAHALLGSHIGKVTFKVLAG